MKYVDSLAECVHSMAIAPDGAIYFGDVQGRRAQKFVPIGKNEE